MKNNIHLKQKKRKEKVVLQKKQQLIEKEIENKKQNDERLDRIFSMSSTLNIDLINKDIPESLKNDLKSHSAKIRRKALIKIKEIYIKNREKELKIKRLEIEKLEAKKELLTELIKESEKIPQVEDIINSAKYILCNQKSIIQTVKPIISHLQENGFDTKNIDIAKTLLQTRQFRRRCFSKIWAMKKPNPVFSYLERKIIIFWNGALGILRKYLPILYKELNK